MPAASLSFFIRRRSAAVIAGTVLFFWSRSILVAAPVEVSTATGNRIEFNNSSGTAVIEGNARIQSSTGTIQADVITMNLETKQANAEGHVVVEQTSGTLTGSRAVYNWEASTGVVYGATGVSPPWRFSADRLIQQGPKRMLLYEGDITSCDLDPPHYQIATTKGRVLLGRRAKLKNARLVVGDLPILYSPFYTRSLVPKKYTLRIEPGQSSRDGFTTRTILGYPFTPNTRTYLRWDFLERTGNGVGLEHDYFSPAIRGSLDTYYIRDINPDPQPQSRRYTLLWNHYQQLLSRLTMNAKVDFKSDQTFGNQFENAGNNILVENQTRGLISEMGLNYQFSKASLQAQFDRRDKFDSSVSSSNFISKLTLPRLTYNTIPLSWKYLPFYTSFSASYNNETLTRESPAVTLRYQQSATVGTQIKRDFKVGRSLTLTPIAGYDQSWQDRLVGTNSEKDVYIGRYNVGGNLRHRLLRNTDLNGNYRYGTRFRANQTRLDVDAADRGIESNQINASLDSWFRGNNRLTFASGYDLREAPRDNPQKYRHTVERITPPSIDIQWELRRNVLVNFRETYGLFDSATQSQRLTPINTSGEVQVGQISRMTYFSQGFSYTKPSPGARSEIVFNNKLRFFLTPKWYIDGYVSYRAVGDGKLDYRKIFPIERTVRVARDLHCWVLRMDFSSRPGVKEASFYIDLKANLSTQRNLFAGTGESSFYTYREEPVPVSQIFPPESNTVEEIKAP